MCWTVCELRFSSLVVLLLVLHLNTGQEATSAGVSLSHSSSGERPLSQGRHSYSSRWILLPFLLTSNYSIWNSTHSKPLPSDLPCQSSVLCILENILIYFSSKWREIFQVNELSSLCFGVFWICCLTTFWTLVYNEKQMSIFLKCQSMDLNLFLLLYLALSLTTNNFSQIGLSVDFFVFTLLRVTCDCCTDR